MSSGRILCNKTKGKQISHGHRKQERVSAAVGSRKEPDVQECRCMISIHRRLKTALGVGRQRMAVPRDQGRNLEAGALHCLGGIYEAVSS